MEQHGDLQERRLELSRISDGYKRAVALNTAQHLGIFEALAEGPMTVEELAARLETDPRNTGLLLNALTGMDLLQRDPGGRFTLHGLAEEFLTPGAEYYMGDIIEHAWGLMRRWVHMDDVVTRGKPMERPSGGRSARQLRAFIMGMQNISKLSAEEVVDTLDLRGVTRILDVGGGPGTYLYAFLRHLPEATGAVLDLPDVVKIAEEQAVIEGVSDRAELIPGDMFSTHFGGPWDLVFLGNIIHSYGFEKNAGLVKRCAEALAPGGRLAIKDFFLDETATLPADGALFSLNMMNANTDGRACTRDEAERWMRDAGLTVTALHSVGTHSGVLVGRKAE